TTSIASGFRETTRKTAICGLQFFIRWIYRRSDVQGLRADHLSVNPRATLKPAWIEVIDSNICS
ncbi:TPA: hypothetical protein ACHWZY_002183, partial [Streptococcus pneumoniae]